MAAVAYPYSQTPTGTKVAPTPMPNPYGDLSKIYPNLSGTNAQVSSDILSKLQGQLSPGTIAAIQNASAQFGVGSGMPGSGLSMQRSLRDIGLTSEQEQQQGIQDYNSTLPTVSSTQTVAPVLQANINSQNAMNAAAPDPAAAASYAQQLYNKYLNRMNPQTTGTVEAHSQAGFPDWFGNPAAKPTWEQN